MESCGADGACDDGAQNGIAVVKVAVLVFGVEVASEILVGEKDRPVSAGCLCFGVLRVAGFYAVLKRGDAVVFAIEFSQESCLCADFGADNLLAANQRMGKYFVPKPPDVFGR